MRTITVFSLVLLTATIAAAQDPLTLDTVVDPGPNRLDEPLAEEFSLDRAVHFLDSASLQWQKQRKCFTCHTNYLYLYARPAVSADAPAHRTVRKFAEQLVTERWPDKGPRWDAEVVATAAALAHNDAAVGSELSSAARTALDRMWTVQRDDGGWDWLKCGWPPMESDDHYGVTLAALAVGVAPSGYANTEQGRQGMQKIRKYLAANPAPTVHHEAMILWAATYVEGLLPAAQKQETMEQLFKLQRPDGGWCIASMGDWKRADGKSQDTVSSDGYATGFALYVLMRAGIPATDPRIERGVSWLKGHQRASGRWISRSLNKDNHHFLSHAGSAMAVLALSTANDAD